MNKDLEQILFYVLRVGYEECQYIATSWKHNLTSNKVIMELKNKKILSWKTLKKFNKIYKRCRFFLPVSCHQCPIYKRCVDSYGYGGAWLGWVWLSSSAKRLAWWSMLTRTVRMRKRATTTQLTRKHQQQRLPLLHPAHTPHNQQ